MKEQALVRAIREVPLKEFDFHGYIAKRRVISFGWGYDFETEKLTPADPIPAFLMPLRGSPPALRGSAEEPPRRRSRNTLGAGINWHKDKAVFEDVIGISLVSPCVFRLRRKAGSKWERFSLKAEPRSMYLLRGPSRWEWEHSIPGVASLRYSITFRTLRR